jgi:hypothetical protein
VNDRGAQTDTKTNGVKAGAGAQQQWCDPPAQTLLQIEREQKTPLGISAYDFNVGLCFEVAQKYQIAGEWYRRAISQDSYVGVWDTFTDNAKFKLGLLYLFGLGVPKDPAQARAVFASGTPSSRDYWLKLLDTGRVTRQLVGLDPPQMNQLLREQRARDAEQKAQIEAAETARIQKEEAVRKAQQKAEDNSAAASRTGSSAGGSSQSQGSNIFGRALCNKMLGTSPWNFMSPCN